MNEVKYLVDNNALIALSVKRVRSRFFRDRCHITPDVLFEASEHPEELLLSELSTEFTAKTFEHIRDLMSSVVPGDTRLLNLYKNKGAADPGLIAWVQEMAAADDGMLLPDCWVLVTNDIAVAELAMELGHATLRPEELAVLIDNSEDGSA